MKPTSEMSYSFKKQSKKKKILSVNFSHSAFSLLSAHCDLVTEVLVWLCMVSFRAFQFGAVKFSASYDNLR